MSYPFERVSSRGSQNALAAGLMICRLARRTKMNAINREHMPFPPCLDKAKRWKNQSSAAG